MNRGPLLLVAAAALVDEEGRILIAQRPTGKSYAGYWEFPGGKIESRETPEGALIRELEEELGIQVSLDSLQPLTFASCAYDNFHLLMPLYLVRQWRGIVAPQEHMAVKWVYPINLKDYPMPEADIPLISVLSEALK